MLAYIHSRRCTVTIGEIFYKKKNVFSTALISGGVSVLYAATASGYFAFDIFSARLTFVICIIVTAVAILLSMQTKIKLFAHSHPSAVICP